MKKILLLMILLNNIFFCNAQNNLNFENGIVGWSIWGEVSITNIGSNDPVIGFPQVYQDGGNKSLLLGNYNSSGFAQMGIGGASQSFVVNQQNMLFRYNYAVVLQSSGHSCNENPAFFAEISVDGVVVPCSKIQIVDGCSSISGWQNAGSVNFLNWKSAIFDLSPYLGQTVTVNFSSRDCTQGGHYGYAYIDCSANELGLTFNGELMPLGTNNSSFCQGSNNVVCGPTVSGMNYSWIGPGVTGQTSNCINTSVAGTYSLTITHESLTCSNIQLYTNLTVTPLPVANFIIDSTCLGEELFLQNTSTSNSNITSQWDIFNDGNIETNSTHFNLISTSIGAQMVELLVVDEYGCKDSILKSVLVYPPSNAQFDFTNDCWYNPLNFNAVSSLNAQNFIWNFGDNFSGSGLQIIHSYSAAGSYPVTLITTSADGCTDTIIQTVNAHSQPLSDFLISPICYNNSSTFNNSSTIVPVTDDSIVSWFWAFDDGITSNLENPIHLYSSEGLYEVSLVTTSNYGCRDTANITATVWPLPEVAFQATTVCEEFATEFINQSSINNQFTTNTITAYEWDLGDGNHTNWEVMGSHTYSNYGTFPVELTAMSSHGCIDSLVLNIIVHDTPNANFDGNNLIGCSSICPEIFSTSSVNLSTLTNFEWILSNVDNYSGPNFSTCIENSSDQTEYYDVQLIVTTDKGCKDSLLKVNFIEVYHLPIADFDFSPDTPDLVNNTVNFENHSLYASTYTWQFGDFSFSTISDPEIIFPYDPISHVVILIASTDSGCTDTARTIIHIKEIPIYYIPNTFTPDGNEYNNIFQPVFTNGFDPQNFLLSIYNRWGELLFESKDAKSGWDGTYQGTLVQEGTYSWTITFKASDSDKFTQVVGHVNVLR